MIDNPRYVIDAYRDNTPAIVMMHWDEEEEYWSQYATLTVNVPPYAGFDDDDIVLGDYEHDQSLINQVIDDLNLNVIGQGRIGPFGSRVTVVTLPDDYETNPLVSTYEALEQDTQQRRAQLDDMDDVTSMLLDTEPVHGFSH